MVKNQPAQAGDTTDTGPVPGLGRTPGGGQGNPLQCSCLEHPMDRGAWQATVHGAPKSQTRLSMQVMWVPASDLSRREVWARGGGNMEATLLGQAQPKPSAQGKTPPLPLCLGPPLQAVNAACWDAEGMKSCMPVCSVTHLCPIL